MHSPSINVWNPKHVAEKTFVYGRGLHPVRMVALRYISELPNEDVAFLGTSSRLVDFIARLVKYEPSLAGLPLVLVRPGTLVTKTLRGAYLKIARRLWGTLERLK